MKNKMLVGCIFSLLSTVSFAAKNHFTVSFDTGNVFEVSINGDSLTWKGLAGEDKGIEQTVKIKHSTLSKNIEVFQWKETRGYFTTFIVDMFNKRAITSTKSAKNQDWLVAGKIT